MGSACGAIMVGSNKDADNDSTVALRGGPLFAINLAPLVEDTGENKTVIAPDDVPATIYA